MSVYQNLLLDPTVLYIGPDNVTWLLILVIGQPFLSVALIAILGRIVRVFRMTAYLRRPFCRAHKIAACVSLQARDQNLSTVYYT